MERLAGSLYLLEESDLFADLDQQVAVLGRLLLGHGINLLAGSPA